MATISAMQTMALRIYFAILALVLLARYIRVKKDHATLSVSYLDGPRFETEAGLTLLEISRMNDQAHASLCGGKGRCGTCRVRVHEGLDTLPDATEAERRTLDRIHAGPNVRLACQVIPPGGTIAIEPLVPAYIEPRDLPHFTSVDVNGVAMTEDAP